MNLFAGTDIEYEEKEEVINVCKAWEDHKKLGIQQGENKMLFTLEQRASSILILQQRKPVSVSVSLKN